MPPKMGFSTTDPAPFGGCRANLWRSLRTQTFLWPLTHLRRGGGGGGGLSSGRWQWVIATTRARSWGTVGVRRHGQPRPWATAVGASVGHNSRFTPARPQMGVPGVMPLGGRVTVHVWRWSAHVSAPQRRPPPQRRSRSQNRPPSPHAPPPLAPHTMTGVASWGHPHTTARPPRSGAASRTEAAALGKVAALAQSAALVRPVPLPLPPALVRCAVPAPAQRAGARERTHRHRRSCTARVHSRQTQTCGLCGLRPGEPRASRSGPPASATGCMSTRSAACHSSAVLCSRAPRRRSSSRSRARSAAASRSRTRAQAWTRSRRSTHDKRDQCCPAGTRRLGTSGPPPATPSLAPGEYWNGRTLQEEGGHPPTPPLRTKGTVVGKNEIYNQENVIRPFLVHKLLGPRPSPLLTLPCLPPTALLWIWIWASSGVADRTPTGLLTPAPPAASCVPSRLLNNSVQTRKKTISFSSSRVQKGGWVGRGLLRRAS